MKSVTDLPMSLSPKTRLGLLYWRRPEMADEMKTLVGRTTSTEISIRHE